MLVTQSSLTVYDPMDCRPPVFSVHGTLQVRILEWVAIPFPGNLPNSGTEPESPALQADSLLSEPPGKPPNWICQFTFLPTVHEGSIFSKFSPELIVTYLFDDHHSIRYEMIYLTVVLTCISLMISDINHLFMYLLAI